MALLLGLKIDFLSQLKSATVAGSTAIAPSVAQFDYNALRAVQTTRYRSCEIRQLLDMRVDGGLWTEGLYYCRTVCLRAVCPAACIGRLADGKMASMVVRQMHMTHVGAATTQK